MLSFTGIPSLRLADKLVQIGALVWRYRFDFDKVSPIGASHASDIAFTFGKTDVAPLPVEWTKDAEKISKNMRDCFISFTRSGSPLTETITQWSQYEINSLNYLSFDKVQSIKNDFIGFKRRLAWNEIPFDSI